MRLRDEDGIALVMAVIVCALLLAMVTTVIQFSTANQRAATASASRNSAHALAEGGIAEAISVLTEPTNNALDPHVLPPATTSQFATGTVTWGGILDGSDWTQVAFGNKDLLETYDAAMPLWQSYAGLKRWADKRAARA